MKEYIFERKTEIPIGGEYYGTVRVKTELIRCKNCEHHRDRINMCDIWHRHTNADGFCHRAKAKSKEQKAKSKTQ